MLWHNCQFIGWWMVLCHKYWVKEVGDYLTDYLTIYFFLQKISYQWKTIVGHRRPQSSPKKPKFDHEIERLWFCPKKKKKTINGHGRSQSFPKIVVSLLPSPSVVACSPSSLHHYWAFLNLKKITNCTL